MNWFVAILFLVIGLYPMLRPVWNKLPRKIDPAAKAIITSLENEPDRWVDDTNYLSLDGKRYEGSSVDLWKPESIERLTLQHPHQRVSRYSERAMWIAYLKWKKTQAKTIDQRNFEQLMEALQPRDKQ